MTTNNKMLEVIRKIALAKKEAKKACNQIAAYEIDQQIRKLTDELVALYEQTEETEIAESDPKLFQAIESTRRAVERFFPKEE